MRIIILIMILTLTSFAKVKTGNEYYESGTIKVLDETTDGIGKKRYFDEKEMLTGYSIFKKDKKIHHYYPNDQLQKIVNNWGHTLQEFYTSGGLKYINNEKYGKEKVEKEFYRSGALKSITLQEEKTGYFITGEVKYKYEYNEYYGHRVKIGRQREYFKNGEVKLDVTVVAPPKKPAYVRPNGLIRENARAEAIKIQKEMDRLQREADMMDNEEVDK